MINIDKSRLLEALDFNPSMLIGKEIISKNIEASKIIDINLKCTHILIEQRSNKTSKWINVNDLDDNVIFDSFDRYNEPRITIKTLLDSLKDRNERKDYHGELPS